MKKIIFLITSVLLLILVGCQTKEPYIGCWEMEQEGAYFKITLTEDNSIYAETSMSEEVNSAKYIIDENTITIVSEGYADTTDFRLISENSIMIDEEILTRCK